MIRDVLIRTNTFLFKAILAFAASFYLVACDSSGGDFVEQLVGIRDGGGVGNTALVFNPSPLDFGNVAVGGTPVDAFVTVTNSTKVPLVITEVGTFTLPEFSILSANCAAETELAANQSCQIQVQFVPTAGINYNDQLRVNFTSKFDRSLSFSNSVNVIGTGVAPLVFAGADPIAAADVTTTRVTLRWTPVAGASSYTISNTTSGSAVTVGTTAGTSSSYTVTGLSASTTYSFRVNALNIVGIGDGNVIDRSTTTDAPGSFSPMPPMSAQEGSQSYSADIGTYCTDSENNLPQTVVISSQTDTDLQCSIATAPARVTCTPNFKTGPGAWSGDVVLSCLLNDFPTPFTQTLTVNVDNTFQSPTMNPIFAQSVTAGQAITPVQAVANSPDGESFTYACLYDQVVDGSVSAGASNCNTLLNQNATNATFTPAGLFNWTPRLVDGNRNFEFRVTATGNLSGLSVSRIFTINVGYPPPSPVTSVVTVSGATVASGGSRTVTLQAKDADGNDLPTGGATVTFSIASGTSTGTFSSVTDNGNGTYTATFTGVLVGTAATISASINGSAVSTALPTITVTPGSISRNTSVISVGTSTIQSGSATTLTLQARDAAGNTITTGGAAIVFSRTGGTSTGTISSTTDVGNGTYTASFTGVLAGTATSISATVNGLAVTTTLPSITVTPGPISVAQSTITITGNPSTVSAGSTVQVVLRSRDAAGNAISTGGLTGIVFDFSGGTSTGSFSGVIDNSDGTYSTVLTGLLAGTASTISATISGTPVTSTLPTLVVVPGPISRAHSLITTSSSSVASGSTATLTLTGYDAYGNALTTGGETVAFAYSGGTSTGTIGTVTNVGNGTYTAIFTGVLAGTPSAVSATIGGSAVTTASPSITVTPGAFNPANSLITASATTVQSGNNVTVTLQARDAAGNNLSTGGSSVVFSRSGGTSTGTFSAVTDNTNGTYTATFTGVLAGTATTVNATVNGTNVTSPRPAITVTPGAISAANSLVTVASGVVQSGSSVSLGLQARDAAGNTVTLGGATVVFNYSGGTSTGTIGSTTDNGNGTYSAGFLGVLAGTATTITATVNGTPVTTTLPTLTVTPGAPSPAQSLVTVSSSSINSGSTSTITLTAIDAAGNLITTGGATVTFARSGGTSTGTISAVTNVGNGTYTATFTGVLSGTATTITATLNSSPVTTTLPTITVNPGAISAANSVVSVSSGTVTSGSSIVATLQARDAAGNNITTGGATVVFSHTGGTSTGTFSATNNVGNGTYTSNFTGVLAGTATSIRASVNGTNISTTLPTVVVVPGVISPVSSVVSVSAASVASGSSVLVTLQARDAAGNAIITGGSTITFSHAGGSSTGSFTGTTDVGNGTYTAQFTGVLAGSATTINADINGTPVSSTLPTVIVTPGPASPTTSIISVSSATVSSGNTVTLSLQARDAAGNNLVTGGATVTFARTGGTSTGNISATTDGNNGSYSAVFTGVLAGTATNITATIGGSAVTTGNPTVTVTPGMISPANSTIAVSNASVASGSSVTVTLTARDAAGNALTGGGSTVVFNRSGGTSTGNFGAVVDNLNGTYSASFTGIVSGTATTIGATVSGINVTTTLPTVTVVPGNISVSTSVVTVSSATVSSGNAVTVTLQGRDAAGNNVNVGGSSVVFGNSGGTSTGTFTGTNDAGNGVYTAQFTGVLAGTPTTLNATIGGSSVLTAMPTVTVSPGLASSATSVISVSSGSVVSGAGITVTLTARDAAGNNLTVGGSTVTFARTGGTSTGNFSAVIDNNDGTYSATFTGVLAGTATTITGTVGGSAVSTTLPTVTVTPGAISGSNSLITVSASSVVSGSSVVATLQARDAAGNNLSTGSATVVFSHTGGTSTGSFSATVDVTNGTYTSNFTGNLAGTATSIRATVNGVSVATTLPTVAVLPGPISPTTSTITLSNTTVQSGSTITATLQARDAAGNTINTGSAAVVFNHTGGTSTGSFAPTVDPGDGTYSSVFTGIVAGTPTTVTATINAANVTTALPAVTVTPGLASSATSTIAVGSGTVQSGSTTVVTLTARDAAGNSLVTGGATVTFSRTGGVSTGNFSAVTDNGNGTYSAIFTGVLAGSATTITGTVGGSAVTTTLPTITVTPGVISGANSIISVSSGTVLSGSSVVATLQARDAAGNNLSTGTATVVFSHTGGTSTGSFSATVDVTNGTYTSNFTGISAGSATSIRATVNGVSVATTLPTVAVLPGPISPVTSTISLSNSTVQSGSSITATLLARDAAGNTITTGGSSVVFSHSGGSSTGSFAGTNDPGDGTYSSVFTGIVAGTPTTVSATINGVSVSSALPAVTVTPGLASSATSTIAVGSGTIQSGNTTVVTLTARDAAGNSLVTGGATVTFSRTGGVSTGNFSAVTDNGDGTYSAIFTGVLAGSATTITGTVGGSAVTTALPTITVTPGAISGSNSVISVSSGTVVSGNSIVATLQARDAAGNNLSTGSATVVFSHTGGTSTGSFSATVDVTNGTYTSNFTGVLAGTATSIRATVNGVSVATTLPTVAVLPGPISFATSTISLSSSTVQSGSSMTASLQARDAAGNTISTGGASVVFTHSGGSSTGSFAATNDPGTGVYSSVFTGIIAGTPTTVNATINGNAVTTSLPAVTVTPGLASSATSTIAVSSPSVQSGNTVTVTLTARDAAGNSLVTGGATVTFARTGGTSTGSFSGVIDNGDGTYSSVFTGVLAGTATTITGTVGGSAVTTTLPTVTVSPGTLSLAQSAITVSSSSVASGANVTLTLTARDAAGNSLTTGGSTVVFNRSGGTSTGTISGTTDVGNGTYTATFTGVVSGTPTSITATVGGAAVTSISPTVTVVPGAISLANSTISVSAATVASGSGVTLTLTGRDAANNALTSGGSSILFGFTGGTSTGSISPTSDNANGTYSATFTGLVAGSATSITATIGGSAVTSASPTVTVTPGPASPTTSLVFVSSATVNSGNTVLVTLQSRDAAGNTISTGGATIGFGNSGGSSTGTFGSVTNVGDGTYTALFTGVLAGTATTITATVGGSPVTTTLPTVQVLPGAVSLAQSFVTVTGNPAFVSSGNGVSVVMRARDAAGNDITAGGLSVSFSYSGGTSTGNFSTVTDSGNGTYSATLTGQVAGTSSTIRAAISGSNLTSAGYALVVVPGAVSLSNSTVAVGSGTVASGSSTSVTVTVRDSFGNQIPSGNTVVLNNTGGTSTGSFSAVTDNGNGTFSANFTGLVAGSPTTITATVNGSAITSVLPTISVIPGVISPAFSIVTVSSGSVVSGNGVTLTLSGRDSNNNPTVTGGATVSFSYTGGTSTGLVSTTTDVGNGTYTATFTGQASGTATTITALINGVSVSTTLPTVVVNTGPISVAQSQVTVSASTVASGSSVIVTLTARDTFGNPITTGGETIVFARSGGTSTGTFSPASDQLDGTYIASFQGLIAGTATTVTATINGSTVTSTMPTITVTPGPISLSQSTVTLSSSAIQAGSTLTATLTARDAAGNLLTTGGRTVVFTISGGTSNGTFAAVSDPANGTYTSVFTGTTSGTTSFISATVDGSALTSTAPSIIVNVGPFSLAHSTLAVSSSTIAAGNTSTFTLTVRDAYGNAQLTGGLTVAFNTSGGTSAGNLTAVQDNNNGTYSATFTGTTAGTALTVSSTINGSAVTTAPGSVTVVPGPISLAQSQLSVSNTTVASGSSVTLTLQTRDAYSNNITTGGQAVVFTYSGGSSTGTISGDTDNSNGSYSAQFTGVVAGSPTTISATINGSTITSTLPTVQVVAGALSLAQSTVTVSSPTVASGSTVTVTLQARDAAGNNITTGGRTVVFSRTGGTSTGNFSAVSDNANGTYTSTFTGIVSGTLTTVTATVNAAPVTSTMPTITVVPGPVSLAQSTLTPAASSVASGASISVTLQARDAAGNNITSGGLIVAMSRSGGTSTGSFSAVVDNNNGTYSADFTGSVAGTPTTLSATIGGSPITSTLPQVTVTPGPVSLANSTVTVGSGSVASGSSVLVTLTARDAQNNLVTAGDLTVTFARSGGTSTGTFSSVIYAGAGQYTSNFTGLVAGTSTTITGSIGGTPLSSAFPTVTVIPGAFSLAQSVVSVSNGTVVSGSAVVVTLQARDSNGNNLTTGGLSVSFGRSGGTSTGNFSAVNDGTDGTYTANFTGVVAGTPTTLTATINSGSVTSTMPTITVTPGAISEVQSSISVASSSVLSGAGVLVTLTARDAAGNIVTGGSPTISFGRTGGTSTGSFSAVTNNNDGTYTSTFTGAVAGTATTITGTINGVSVASTLPTVQVLPGALSLAQSFVSVSSPTVISGNTVTLTFTARDASGNNITTGGQSVLFSRTGGTSAGNISSTTDNANGTYTAIFTATTSGSATSISATVGGSSVTSTLPTITVSPGAISLSQSLISVSSGSTQSGSNLTVTLTTRDAAGNFITTGSATVLFGHSGGTSTVSFGSTTDNGDGTYTAVLTGLASGTPTTLTATINALAVTSAAPTVTVNPGPFSVTQSTITRNTSSITAGSTANVTLISRDAYGNNLTTGGVTVVFGNTGGTSTGTFSAVTDANNGTYTATFTGSVAGTPTTLTATMNGTPVSSVAPTIEVTPGNSALAQSIVSVSSSSVVAGGTVTLTLQARDALGNNQTSGGLTVVFTRSGGGSNGTISGTTDNNDGTYTATFSATTAGTATTIGATIGGAAVTSTLPTITVTPGAYSLAQSQVTVSPSTVVAGSTSIVTLRARDSFGNNLTTGGTLVTFGLTGGTSNGTFAAVTDNGDGTYTSIFTGETAGTVAQLTATMAGSAVTSTMPNITVTPGAFSVTQSTIAVSSGTISSGATSTVTLTARDAYNNILTSGGLSISFARTGGTSSGTFGAVSDNLNGTYSAIFTGTTAGSPTTITGNINGTPISSTLPTVTVLPGAFSLAQSELTVGNATVPSGTLTTLTLRARDSFGNNLTSGGLTVVFTRTGGTSNGSISVTTDNGDGTYSANFQGTTAGTATTISASINGGDITSTLPTITVVPGAVSFAQSTVSVIGNPSILASGSTATIRLVTRDSSGNLVTSGGLSVAFTSSGGTSTVSYSAVIDNNNGTYEATVTGLAAGTAINLGSTIAGTPVSSVLPSLAVVPGPHSLASSTISLTGSSVSSGSTRTATVTVRDTYGNQLTTGGLTVAVTNSGGTSTVSVGSVTDNNNGTYTAVITGVLSGTATTIIGSIAGANLTSTLPTLIVNPGSFSTATSTIVLSSNTAASETIVTATLQAKDAAGNNITSGGIVVAFTATGGTSTGNISGTTDNNNGTYTATIVTKIAGTATTIGATMDGSAVTSTLPQLTVIPGVISTTTSVVQLSNSSVASGSSIIVTLQARDVNGNNLISGGSTVTFELIGGGTSTGNFGTVNDNANGTYSANFTGVVAGSARNVSARIGGSSITSALPSVSVIPGPVSLATSLITSSDTSVVLGASITFTLQARDAQNNIITTGGLSVGFNTSGGTSTGSVGATSDNNNGTYTASFTGTSAGTAVEVGATIGGATVTSTPKPSVTVLPLPVLNAITESLNTTTPIAPLDIYTFNHDNIIPDPDNDNGMTYTCWYDRILDGTVAESALCTTLPGSATFNTSTGEFSWTVPTVAAGPWEFRVRGCTSAGCDAKVHGLNVKQGYTTTDLIADLDAQFAEGLISPGQNIPITSIFKNLVVGAPLRDATLTSDMQSSNPWLGNGTATGNGTVTAAGPYRLNFNGSSNYLDLSPTITSMPASIGISTWIRPGNIASSANGSVIISNGGGAGTISGGSGIEILQSRATNGRLELAVAGMSSWDSVEPTGGPFIRYRLSETTLTDGSTIADSSGNGRDATLRLFTAGGFFSSGTGGIPGEPNNLALTSGHPTPATEDGNIIITNTAFPTAGFQQFSFEMWIRTPAAYNVGGMLLMMGNRNDGTQNDNNHDRKLWLNNNGTITAGIYCNSSCSGGNGTRVINSTGVTVNDGNWHHIVMTYDYLDYGGTAFPGTLKLYINGGNGTTLGTPFSFPGTGLAQVGYNAYIKMFNGRQWSEGAGATQHAHKQFEGSIDEIVVWDRALTPTEIVQRARARTCRSTTTFANNTFYNIGATFDDVTKVGRLFVNGVEECNMTFPGASITSALPLTLGARPVTGPSYSNYWSGGVGEVKIYSNSNPGISTIYSATAPRYP